MMKSCLFGGALLAAGLPAFAQSGSLGSEASFQASLSEFDFEDFNGGDGTLNQYAANPFNGFTVSANGTSSFAGDFEITGGELGLFIDTTPNYIPSFTFQFDSPIDAVGFMLTSPDSAGGLIAWFGDDPVVITEDAFAGLDGSGENYVVLTSDIAFTSLTLQPADEFEFVLIDNLTSGTLIPTPGTAGLMVLAGLAAARRRR